MHNFEVHLTTDNLFADVNVSFLCYIQFITKTRDLYYCKLAVLSHYQNRRFCPIFKIGDFVPFLKAAVLSQSKIGGFVSHPLNSICLPNKLIGLRFFPKCEVLGFKSVHIFMLILTLSLKF